MRAHRSQRRSLIAIAATGILLVPTVVVRDADRAAAVSGAVTGRVFLDRDSDGRLDAGEPGVGSVEVTAYDAIGSLVASATTGNDGTYSLGVDGAVSDTVRVEFTTPDGYQPSFSGADNGTDIRFVTLPATSVDHALIIPGNFCADNVADPMVIINCQLPGKATNTATNNDVATKKVVAYTTWNGREEPTEILQNQ